MAEHLTKCWMGPKLRGTDEERAELKREIVVALRSCAGNITNASVLLGVHVATLARYVDRLGLGAELQRARSTKAAGKARTERASKAGKAGGRSRPAA